MIDFTKKSKLKLSTHMAFISAILIGIIVLLLSAYEIVFLKDTSTSVSASLRDFQKTMAASMFKRLGDEYDNKNFVQMNKIVQTAIQQGGVAYFIIKDNKTNIITFSSVRQLEGKPFNKQVLNGLTAADTQNFTLAQNTPTYFINGARRNDTLYIGFFTQSVVSQRIDKFTDNMSYMIFWAIMLGLILSHIFTRIITTPLKKLSEASSKFAKGDFNHRIPYFNYEEIDELVDSYNVMAENLKDLYESLENKVADRTQALKKAYDELKNTQAMMVHSEKMKSLGELVAGITHEINNPINFIYGNLIHFTNYTNDLLMLIDKYGEYEEDLKEEHKKEIEQIKSDIDLDFLKTDIVMLVTSCKEGTERTKNIILDLKNFSRMEERVLSSINIPKEIDTTLNILHSKWKNRVEIHKDYEEDLPLVESYGGQLNQVFMNILDNAFYAIENKGDVYISTKKDGENVIIEFKDTGKGMPREVAEKIFDPFFTTKPVGQGTGLGMSISYRVIQEHHGLIKVKSEEGKGTTFTITLPITFVREEQKDDKESVTNEQ